MTTYIPQEGYTVEEFIHILARYGIVNEKGTNLYTTRHGYFNLLINGVNIPDVTSIEIEKYSNMISINQSLEYESDEYNTYPITIAGNENRVGVFSISVSLR